MGTSETITLVCNGCHRGGRQTPIFMLLYSRVRQVLTARLLIGYKIRRLEGMTAIRRTLLVMFLSNPSGEPGLLRVLYKRVRVSDIVRHGLLVMTATTFANICAFFFHAIVSRELGVASYGSLYALLSLVSIASLPAAVLTTVVAKFAAEFRALDDPSHLRALLEAVCKIFGIVALLYVGCGFIFSARIGIFLQVPGWAVILVAGTAALSLLSLVLKGVAQGTQDFVGFSVCASGEGVGKALFGGLLTAAKLGLVGGLTGFFAGILLGGLYILRRLWVQFGGAPRTQLLIDWRRVASTAAGAAALTISTTILSSGDVLVVKHFFSAHDSGIYSAASLGGKMLLFLVGFAPLVLLPKTVDRQSRGRSPRAVLAAAVAIVMALSAAGLVSFKLASGLILHSLVGNDFSAAAGLLVWYGLAMVLLALINVVAAYSVALHKFAFSLPLILATLVEMVAIFLHHPNLASIVMTLVLGNAVALSAVIVPLLLRTSHAATPP